MKKAFLLLTMASVFAVGAKAQTQRMVLVEHFTNASCGPCALYNPTMQAVVDDPQNAGRLTSIKYQWYFPGYDPMHNHNPGQANDRTSYYGINGVPTTNIGGDGWQGNAGNFNQNLVDTEKAMTSPFEITLSHHFNENADQIVVDMKIKATGAVSGALRAHIAVIETEINFAQAPGSNGERDFYNVMKRMLPTVNGTVLPSNFNVGDSVVIQQAWVMKNIYDYQRLAVVGFVQDNQSRHHHQAAYSAPVSYAPSHSLNVHPLELTNIPDETCESEIQPSFKFRNGGSTTITSADFEYSINGGTAQAFNWTGNLAFNDETTVSLGTLPFTLQNVNDIKIWPTAVNSSADQYTVGDTVSVTFNETSVFNPSLIVDLIAHQDADKTSWKVWSSDGQLLAESGAYENGVQKIDNVTLKNQDCFLFHFFQNNNSSFKGVLNVTDLDGNSVISNTFGPNEVLKNFTILESALSTEDNLSANKLVIFPNPSNGVVRVLSTENANAEVVDVTGKTVQSIQLLNGVAVEIDGLTKGVYFLKSDIAGQEVQKIVIK